MIKKITQETSLGWEGALSVTLLYTQIDFFGGSDGKASVYNVGDPGSIPGREDLLEKEVAVHSSTIAWKIP